MLLRSLRPALGPALRPQDPNPFDNTNAAYAGEGLEVHAFCWQRDDQPYNLKWEDIVISWHPYAGRGCAINAPLSSARAQELYSGVLSLLPQLTRVDRAAPKPKKDPTHDQR